MNAFAQDLAWVVAALIVIVLALDFWAMVRRTRRWRDIDRSQRGAELRREWKGRGDHPSRAVGSPGARTQVRTPNPRGTDR